MTQPTNEPDDIQPDNPKEWRLIASYAGGRSLTHAMDFGQRTLVRTTEISEENGEVTAQALTSIPATCF